jgi:hypothetical protein
LESEGQRQKDKDKDGNKLKRTNIYDTGFNANILKGTSTHAHYTII